MRQLKVRFTVEHHNEQSCFTSLDELKQQSYSDLLLKRIADFEERFKRTAADYWLLQRLNVTNHPPYQLMITHEKATASESNHIQRA